MSLRARLVLAFAVVFALGFGALGFGAVRATADTIERGLGDRIDQTLKAVCANPAFFIHEASLRGAELGQLADISGFEILVLEAVDGPRAGSSLPADAAERAREALRRIERDRVVFDGAEYRVAKVAAGGRTLYLLAPEAPVTAAKDRARRPILLCLGLSLVASILLGTLIAGSVTRPLRRLAERAAEVSRGRLDSLAPHAGGGEVGELSRAFSEMVSGLRRYREELLAGEKMATLGRFSSAVAHELRNPLSGMRMTAQMMRREAPPAMATEIDALLGEMARLDHTVEELLFHAGEPRYVMRRMDLRDPLLGVVRVLSPLASHLGVRLCEESPPQGVPAEADADRMRQALMNLVLNAIQASPPGGTVTARLSHTGGRVACEVADEGPGVPPDIAPRLFTPFVSGREGGTGLGLCVTLAIARAHGGEVDHRREEGRTIFRLSLPAGEGPWRGSS